MRYKDSNNNSNVAGYEAIGYFLAFIMVMVCSFYYMFTRAAGEIKPSDRKLLVYSSIVTLIIYSASSDGGTSSKKSK